MGEVKNWKDALSEVEIIQPSDYGRLPIREDVLLMKSNLPLLNQWEKLNILRRNLKIIARYLSSSRGETLAEWLQENGDEGVSKEVLNKIGMHNDDAGGVSVFFLNLQNYYDNEEAKYDQGEAGAEIPADVKKEITPLRDIRIEKRKARRVVRKSKLKDLKTDGKGFLVIESPEKTLSGVHAASGSQAIDTTASNGGGEKTQEDASRTAQEHPHPADKKLADAVKSAKSNSGVILVSLAGFTMAIATIWAINKSNS